MRKEILATFVTLLSLAFTINASAQAPCFGKMSPLVREACLVSQVMGTRASSDNGLTKTITAFVKTDGRLPLTGCDVLARYGNLYVARIPISRLGFFSRQNGILRMEAGRSAHTTMDTTAFIVGATALHDAVSLPQAYTGKGVVVGVEDIGFDLTNPNFCSADMSRYRIKAMWDQLSTDTLQSSLPVGRDYTDSISLLTLGRPRDGDKQTHGTHTAGIAAGSGSEGSANSGRRYVGIAPDADLCFVCNATGDDSELVDSADYYKYTFALDALGFKYIFDYADKVGKPCVINFSEGSQEDFEGYDNLYYEMIDSLVGPGHIIVASAGNEGRKTNYLFKPASEDTANVFISGQWHAKAMSFTTRSSGDLRLRVIYNNVLVKEVALGDILEAKDSILMDSLSAEGSNYGIAAAAYPDSYGTGKTTADWVITSSDYLNNKTFKIQISGNSDVELYAGSGLLNNNDVAKNTSNVIVDNSHSILSPGSAPNVICVGMTGYRTRFVNYEDSVMNFGGSANGEINANSSVGPTYDGRIKPDVVAPGQNIISSYSTFYIENNPNASTRTSCVRRFTYNGRTYGWYSDMGTSMSAPVVTGVIALWLQANPRLTPKDCLDIIAKTSTHYDTSLSYPNNIYGYGQIDALAGMRLALDKAAGIESIRYQTIDKNKIYTLDGICVGNDIKNLPQGVYIKNGKKITIK